MLQQAKGSILFCIPKEIDHSKNTIQASKPLLARRGWRISMFDLPAEGTRLKAHEQRLVTFDVHAGVPFTKADAKATTERDIVVTATADGATIGGMIYRIDVEMESYHCFRSKVYSFSIAC